MCVTATGECRVRGRQLHLWRLENRRGNSGYSAVENVAHLERVMFLLDQQAVVAQLQEIDLVVAEQPHTNAAKWSTVYNTDKFYREK
jgi:hypothetical protein